MAGIGRLGDGPETRRLFRRGRWLSVCGFILALQNALANLSGLAVCELSLGFEVWTRKSGRGKTVSGVAPLVSELWRGTYIRKDKSQIPRLRLRMRLRRARAAAARSAPEPIQSASRGGVSISGSGSHSLLERTFAPALLILSPSFGCSTVLWSSSTPARRPIAPDFDTFALPSL